MKLKIYSKINITGPMIYSNDISLSENLRLLLKWHDYKEEYKIQNKDWYRYFAPQ